MFGLAVWDEGRERLVLARDRAGEKPLFWTEIAGELRFASEIQALLVYPDQARRVNGTAAALYAALGYVPAPHTMFAGIAKLPPAHVLVADHTGVTLRSYWQAPPAPARPSRLDGAPPVRAGLLRAVARGRLAAGPGVGFPSAGPCASCARARA